LRVTTYVERRLLNASSLHSKLRTLGIPVADAAMVDVLGMCIYASPFMIAGVLNIISANRLGVYYIHIGVGFEVAYLNRVASSKARSVR